MSHDTSIRWIQLLFIYDDYRYSRDHLKGYHCDIVFSFCLDASNNREAINKIHFFDPQISRDDILT